MLSLEHPTPGYADEKNASRPKIHKYLYFSNQGLDNPSKETYSIIIFSVYNIFF
jgi:hypothetical protein